MKEAVAPRNNENVNVTVLYQFIVHESSGVNHERGVSEA